MHWVNPEIPLLSHSTEAGNKTHPWLKLFLQLCQLEQSYQIHVAKIYYIASYSCNTRSTRKQHCSRTRALGCPDTSSYVCALCWNNITFFQAIHTISVSTKASENAAKQVTIVVFNSRKKKAALEMKCLLNVLFFWVSVESRSVSKVRSVLYSLLSQGKDRASTGKITPNVTNWKSGEKILSCNKPCSRHQGNDVLLKNCWIPVVKIQD